jgi:hypothetical protein
MPRGEVCCADLAAQLAWKCDRHKDWWDCPDCLIRFFPSRGEYGLPVHDGGSSYIRIRHCPWCGAGLDEFASLQEE